MSLVLAAMLAYRGEELAANHRGVTLRGNGGSKVAVTKITIELADNASLEHSDGFSKRVQSEAPNVYFSRL